MSYKILNKKGDWLVQVQRDGIRRTKRGKGGATKAKRAEEKLIAKVETLAQKKNAAEVLGLDPQAVDGTKSGSVAPPMFSEYLKTRWASHVMVAQNDTTRRTTATHVAYLTYFFGEKRIDQIGVADINGMIEKLNRDGPLSFKLRKDGKPRQRRKSTFAAAGINKILGTLLAALRLAKSEDVITNVPNVDMLPSDDSKPIVPPTDTEYHAIIEASKAFSDIAPLFPEVIQLDAETGLRESELFNLRWRSIDFSLGETGCVRIEEQRRTRIVNGKPWKPKHQKFRVVPLSPLARRVLNELHGKVPNTPDDLVIPSRGGCPYVRIEHAPDRSGKGWWHDVLDAAGLKGRVRFHDLRHLFAVRCLQHGVPIAAVSAWLGHSDINLTVKRYGRWSHEAREQWEWIKKLDKPIDAVAREPWLTVVEGGKAEQRLHT